MATLINIAARLAGAALCGLIVGLLATAVVLLAGGTREAADVVGTGAMMLTSLIVMSGK